VSGKHCDLSQSCISDLGFAATKPFEGFGSGVVTQMSEKPDISLDSWIVAANIAAKCFHLLRHLMPGRNTSMLYGLCSVCLSTVVHSGLEAAQSIIPVEIK
jgi:hypothetical protein